MVAYYPTSSSATPKHLFLKINTFSCNTPIFGTNNVFLDTVEIITKTSVLFARYSASVLPTPYQIELV